MSREKYIQLIRNYKRNSALVRRIGERIRAERQAAGLTQRELAERLRIKQPNLAAIEKGRVSPTIEILEVVCRLRGRSLDWLLFGEKGAGRGVSEVEEPYVPKGRARIRLPVMGRLAAKPGSDVGWEATEPQAWCELPAGAQLIEVEGDALSPVALAGQKVVVVEGSAGDGDLVAVELKDGRQLFRRWWRHGRRAVLLASLRQDGSEPPVVERLDDIRRVWRIIGVIF